MYFEYYKDGKLLRRYEYTINEENETYRRMEINWNLKILILKCRIINMGMIIFFILWR
jgi:hypothetical protein